MNRRQFLMGIPASAVLTQRAGAQAGTRIRQVDIVHHTHTDVGYTALPSVVRDFQQRYIDAAMAACQANPGFRWTIESLLELDDWWRASNAAKRARLAGLVKAGRIDVMGMPFNQTPCLNAMQWRQMMNWIPRDIWREMNIRAAMQNDVNGFPRAGALGLLDHGINHFLMGINADSGGPPFWRPTAFWWKMPDGRRLFVWLGEHYGSAMNYLNAAWDGARMRTEEDKVRAAHAEFVKHMAELESQGYGFERLILTFTNPVHYDNGAPVPSLAPFIAAWNKLGLEPSLRFALATEAVFDMEKAVAASIPEFTGEWTDWWANGAASSPRELTASRLAKRRIAAAFSPAFGPMPQTEQPQVQGVLRDLCLFDEHTWGAAASVSAPYSLDTLGQFVEKSELAYRPMGMAEALLSRRVNAAVNVLRPEGPYVINPANAAVSGWAGKQWIEKLAANSVRPVADEAVASTAKPDVKLDASGWPVSAMWNGMSIPLFDGAAAEFLCVGVVPPADRRTIAQLHATPDPEKRKASLRETAATYGEATASETPHTLRYEQPIRHERLADARRTLELWKREPRARMTVRFDRISSLAPEVFFLGFEMPDGVEMPVFSCGGVPFTPYRDQLRGSSRDYFAIDGWAHYPASDGHRLWVTRDAPLVAVGGPHVLELHQQEPAEHRRILAMVFDNCWHTNFVADEHGTMEFQFELAWQREMPRPADVAEALTADLILAKSPSRA